MEFGLHLRENRRVTSTPKSVHSWAVFGFLMRRSGHASTATVLAAVQRPQHNSFFSLRVSCFHLWVPVLNSSPSTHTYFSLRAVSLPSAFKSNFMQKKFSLFSSYSLSPQHTHQYPSWYVSKPSWFSLPVHCYCSWNAHHDGQPCFEYSSSNSGCCWSMNNEWGSSAVPQLTNIS